jgi:hypothetical protein
MKKENELRNAKKIILTITIPLILTLFAQQALAATTYYNTSTGNNISIGNPLFIDNSNSRVGVGTTGPDTKLHLIGSICAETSDTGCNPTNGYVRGTGLCIGTDCRTTWPSGGGNASILGNAGYIAQFQNSTHLNNSQIYQSGNQIAIGTTTPLTNATLTIQQNNAANGKLIINSSNYYAGQLQIGNPNPNQETTILIMNNATAYGSSFTGTYKYILGIGALNDSTTNTQNKFTLAALNTPGYGNKIGLVWDGGNNIGIAYPTPTTALDIDTNSNTLGLRIRGTAETTEIGDIYVGAGGQLKITTENTGAASAYVETDPEDDQYD